MQQPIISVSGLSKTYASGFAIWLSAVAWIFRTGYRLRP